jgi:hypothetical protein
MPCKASRAPAYPTRTRSCTTSWLGQSRTVRPCTPRSGGAVPLAVVGWPRPGHRVRPRLRLRFRGRSLRRSRRREKPAEGGCAGAGHVLQPSSHCVPLGIVDLDRLERVARGSSSSARNATLPQSPCATPPATRLTPRREELAQPRRLTGPMAMPTVTALMAYHLTDQVSEAFGHAMWHHTGPLQGSERGVMSLRCGYSWLRRRARAREPRER